MDYVLIWRNMLLPGVTYKYGKVTIYKGKQATH